MSLTQLARIVTIRLGPEGFKVEFEGAMWGKRYIDQAHRAMLRGFPRYLAEAKKKGEVKDDKRSDRTGEGQRSTDRGEGEGFVDRADNEERRVGVIDESGINSGTVQCSPRPDGGAGQDDREANELLKKGEVRERPKPRRASSGRT